MTETTEKDVYGQSQDGRIPVIHITSVSTKTSQRNVNWHVWPKKRYAPALGIFHYMKHRGFTAYVTTPTI